MAWRFPCGLLIRGGSLLYISWRRPYPGIGYLGEGMRIAVTQKNVHLALELIMQCSHLNAKAN